MIWGETQKTRMLIGMQTVKDRLRRFQIGTVTLLEVGLEGICVTFWQRPCLHFAYDLRLSVRLNLKVAV